MTSFSDNHLDWHGSLDHYRACKQAILDHQGPNDCAVLGPGLRGSFTPRAGRVIEVRGAADAHDLPPLALPGDHNRVNAALAVAAAESLGVPRNEAAAACAACRGLPHRLQWLCEWAGVRFYNDSKATTPQAASLALDSFPQGVVHLIMGGADKGSDLRPLAAHAAGHARAVYTLGALGEMLADLVRPHGGAQVHACGTLRRAVETALTQVRAGDVVLLSPGCSSLDQFPNYEERGRAFAEAVLQCTSEGAVPPRVG
jgi:UDP-N-acetylmuramoylalanine--D-glutamate ligase